MSVHERRAFKGTPFVLVNLHLVNKEVIKDEKVY